MAKKTSKNKNGVSSKLEKLDFLKVNWHTEGEVKKSEDNPAIQIKGMDTYEWICGG